MWSSLYCISKSEQNYKWKLCTEYLYLLKHLWSFISLYLKMKIWIPISQSGSRCLMWALSNQWMLLPLALSTSLRHYQKESSKVSLSPHFYQYWYIFVIVSLTLRPYLWGKQGHKDFPLNRWEYKEDIYIVWPIKDSTMA